MSDKSIRNLISETARHLKTEEASGRVNPAYLALTVKFINDMEHALRSELPEQRRESGDVRGLRYAPIIFEAKADPNHNDLQRAAKEAFAFVRWSEFYEESTWTNKFLPNFANGEGVGPDGRYRHDSLIIGLFILGPKTLYPAHAHPAEEFYLVVSGSAAFQVGDHSAFEKRVVGDVIIHENQISHAIHTEEEPLFAIFGWRGAINEPSWYRNDMKDPTSPMKWPSIRKE